MNYVIREKKNRLARHAICSTRESAEKWIANVNPEIFMDKTLTKDSFEISEECEYY